MSSASKITLALAAVISGGIVFFVHYMQQTEREQLHLGVLKDIERQSRRKENINILQQQQDLTRMYQESQQNDIAGKEN